jgi:cyclohexanecarboxylate-CoA ligase
MCARLLKRWNDFRVDLDCDALQMASFVQMNWPAPSFELAAARAYRASGSWNDLLITDYLDGFAASAPERVAIVDSRNSITYQALQQRSYHVAQGLLEAGVRPGSVVAVQLPNWIEFATLHLALVRLGCVTCIVTPSSRTPEVETMLRIAGARWLVVVDEFRGVRYASMAADLCARIGRLQAIVVGAPEAGMLSWAQVAGASDIEMHSRRAIDALRPLPDAVAEIVFTSGTSGTPKGAIHTHNTLIAPQLAMARSLCLDGDSVLHMASTLGHQTGFLNGLRLPVQVGCTVVLQDTWNPGHFASLIETHGINVSSGSATFLLDLLRAPEMERHDLSSLKVFRCGGGPIPTALVREAEQRLPQLKVLRGWGQTENGVVTLTSFDDPLNVRTETDGRAQTGMTVRVVGPDRAPLPNLVEGEVQVRGAAMSPAYVNSPDMMPESMTDGWFNTGDLAVMDEHGYIRITGRVKDIVIRGGENVPVHYVENVLYKHPNIQEVAIVGIPDDRLGERCCAFVICRSAKGVTLDELRTFLSAEGVAKPYWPERLEIVHDFPRSANGKVQKARLRDAAAQGELGFWSEGN